MSKVISAAPPGDCTNSHPGKILAKKLIKYKRLMRDRAEMGCTSALSPRQCEEAHILVRRAADTNHIAKLLGDRVLRALHLGIETGWGIPADPKVYPKIAEDIADLALVFDRYAVESEVDSELRSHERIPEEFAR